MKTTHPPHWLRNLRLGTMGITFRTALMAWLVSISTLMIFVMAVIPEQKRAFLANLESKAHGVTVSLRDITAGAAVNEDFSSVVDQCIEMLKGDPAIDYIVITRNDGFSVIHDRAGWRSAMLDGRWVPGRRVPSGLIDQVPLFNRRVYAYAEPFDYSGIQWGWIHVGLSVSAYDRAVAGVYHRTAFLVGLTVLFGLAASVFYARHLSRPILLLQGVVERIASGDLSARAPVDREDELGHLAESVNTMTRSLLERDSTLKEANEFLEHRVSERTRELREQIAERERAHRELAEAQNRLMQLSREAGMAEVATGVLHNVGNVLNSANVSVSLLYDSLRNSELPQFSRTIALLEEQGDQLPRFLTEDPRGRLVTPFLRKLSERLNSEQSQFAAETASLTRNIEHIKEIVAMQQTFARSVAVIERVDAVELINHALEIHKGSIARHRVQVRLEAEPGLPPLFTDRHGVLQILTNFVSNAIHAADFNPPDRREITVRLRRRGADRISLAVCDNGAGISPENLGKVFRFGFTTRKEGHGFGLHSGVLIAKSLGGAMEVESPGPGAGATFTLILPLSSSPAPAGPS